MCIGSRIKYSMRVLTEKREFSLILLLSFTHFLSLFLSRSLLSRSLRPETGSLRASLRTLLNSLCNMPKGSPCATVNARSRARHSYAKQINSLKETNLYLPHFLSLSFPLYVPFPRERRAAARERLVPTATSSLKTKERMIP